MMTRLWPEGDPIDVTLDRAQEPAAFAWQGRTHPVRRIRQRWQVDSEWWSPSGRVWRDYVAITTGDGLLCVLFHDRLAEAWFLEKVYD
ncbi:MAG: hypothetical protein KBG20_03875 [Caldilineaceae bacterium]|nr:hypothetical protein [Caldilineaceae bacterium]MBP8106536.1 hypothetical protein [Caldilineaceae bacterium]MBP8121558.1 hypothetical protein [Caldilineaceae bacterium]MBP9071407.1 hypothetical protein [Caldilineaceae bacterium]